MKRGKIQNRLEELQVRPSKQRGQNFLSNPEILRGIVRFGAARAGERLVEIGGGLGALTGHLAPLGNLTVIELEPQFCAELKRLFPDITVVEADARTFPFESLGANLVVYGNVPYVYSTEILFNLIRSATQIDRVILLLQREFVERMAAKPGGKTYGILSVMVQLWADVEMGSIIGGGSFHPPTKVESRLVLLRFHRTPRYQVKNYELLRSVVRAAFSQRRRMITNSLRSLGYGTPGQIRTALERSGIPITDRAERVPIEKFVRLAEEVATFAPALTESSNPFPTAPISEIDSFDEAEGKVREEKIDETNR